MEQEEAIRSIRNCLRLTMNGIAATAMREKGMHYKLIFGTSLTELRKIAETFRKDASAELAEALWKEDVRELKILATLLYPAGRFTRERAEAWIAAVPYPEIAGQLARNLLRKTANADETAARLLHDRQHAYARTVAFMVFVYLFADGRPVAAKCLNSFFDESVRTLAESVRDIPLCEKQAVLTALKRYGRQSDEQARRVLDGLMCLKESPDAERREIYHDIAFELAFYGSGLQIQINALPLPSM